MVSIESVVWAVLWLLGAAAVFGLLFYAVVYCEQNFPGFPLFFKAIRIFLVVAVCFILIFMILGLMGHPIIRF